MKYITLLIMLAGCSNQKYITLICVRGGDECRAGSTKFDSLAECKTFVDEANVLQPSVWRTCVRPVEDRGF